MKRTPSTVLLLAMLAPRSSQACPSCAPGMEARAQVWANHFWFNVLLAAAPFAVVGIACALAEWSGRRAPRTP